MADRSAKPITDHRAKLGRPLAPWTYTEPALLRLEHAVVFRRRWQFVGHRNDWSKPGQYLTLDIGPNSVIVLRGKDDELRAFLNVCRHRGSRLVDGAGVCKGVIQCPYHGWTYRFDGSLGGIAQVDNFTDIDRAQYSLHPAQLEVFHGLVFVRIEGSGPSVAEQFAHTGKYFEQYGVADYVQIAPPSEEIWAANWKIAYDNYLENYHIPVAHPGLHRLVKESGEFEELDSGVNYGVFVIRDTLSTVDEERAYQKHFHHANARVPDAIKGKWVQFGYAPGHGIDLYPEMLDLMQIIPLGVDQTLVRTHFYGHQSATDKERELRRLNMIINDQVNREDREICQRMQSGLATPGYQPGPLSSEESSVYHFHQLLRSLLPVTSLAQAPAPDALAATNIELKIPTD